MILQSHDLVKSFGGVTAVDHLSLEVEKGSVFGIIGPNGSGKTTFFNLINGVYPPTSGTITFNGRNITGLFLRPGSTSRNRAFRRRGVLQCVIAAGHGPRGPEAASAFPLAG